MVGAPRIRFWTGVCLFVALASAGCSKRGNDQDNAYADDDGEIAAPPFEVKGNAEGLLLVWFDAQGAHTAGSRDEIPTERRRRVRVDSPALAPSERLDPDYVYVADLGKQAQDGSYLVRKVTRERFDSWTESAAG